jgi:4'-phosphopantetheinyl transferase
MDQITEQFFSAKENAVFRALILEQDIRSVFKCWTHKEAFLKAVGEKP